MTDRGTNLWYPVWHLEAYYVSDFSIAMVTHHNQGNFSTVFQKNSMVRSVLARAYFLAPTSVLVVFPLLWWNTMAKVVHRRTDLFGLMVPSGKSPWWWDRGLLTGAGIWGLIFWTRSRWGFLLSKPTSSDMLPLTRPHLNIPQQGHQLGTKYPNAQDSGDISFKPLNTLRVS